MKKLIFTNKTDVRLGFEIECAVLSENWGKFCKGIRPFRDRLSTGTDGSIDCNYWNSYHPVEIRTKPLSPKDAMELLETLFNIVNKYGITNATCGFHVNISSARKSKMKNFNPLPFLSSKLWNQILRKFNRSNNTYCKSILQMRGRGVSKVSMLKGMSGAVNDKYRCVSLSNFGNGMQKGSRVEVRAFGNKNYTKRFKTVAGFVKRIERLFQLSCKAGPLTRTYEV